MTGSDYSNEISLKGSTGSHKAATVDFAIRRLFLDYVLLVFTSPLT
jgi:hypothetical protein